MSCYFGCFRPGARAVTDDAITLLLPAVLRNLDLAFDKKGAMKNERSCARFLECLYTIAAKYPAVVTRSLMLKVVPVALASIVTCVTTAAATHYFLHCPARLADVALVLKQTLSLLRTSEISRKNAKLNVLRILHARTPAEEDMFNVVSPYLQTFLLDRDANVQAATIGLLHDLVPRLSLDEVRASDV